MIKDIHWLGHDTFRVMGDKVIYTDPFKIKKKDKADIILITHEHYDHCSPEDVKKIQGPDTVIVCPADCAKKLSGNIRIVKAGDTVSVSGISVEAVPSYNTNKQFHTKDKGWVGYIFTVKGQRIYIAGDTDYIPEMKTFRADVALLPVSGTYVMTAEEAIRAALDIKPKVAVPMHYGSIVGSKNDAERFADGLKGKIEVAILPEEQVRIPVEPYFLRAQGDRMGRIRTPVDLPAGWNVISMDVTDSTNTAAMELGKKNAPHGTVVVADRQTKGKGRLGRE